jgi:hypothetical protein
LPPRTDLSLLADQLVVEQPLISESRKPQLLRLLRKLLDKQCENEGREYGLFKVLRAHILPLTNCAFNKGGDRFITGSYDRTCKVWDTASGKELASLEGHKNVVYAISFNNPFGCVGSPGACLLLRWLLPLHRARSRSPPLHARDTRAPPPPLTPPLRPSRQRPHRHGVL